MCWKVQVERYQSSIDEEQNFAEPLPDCTSVLCATKNPRCNPNKNLLDACDCLCGKKSHKDGKKTKKAFEQVYAPPKS